MNLSKCKSSKVDEETKKKVKHYGLYIDKIYKSPMNKIFSGSHITHIRCRKCSMVRLFGYDLTFI